MKYVDFYLHALGVPARRYVNNAEVKKGEENFYKAKCDLCHMPTLHTRADAPLLLNGTRLPWLCNQVIHPYSDYLHTRYGAQELDDHLSAGLATGAGMADNAIMGYRLWQEVVNGHTNSYMTDVHALKRGD